MLVHVDDVLLISKSSALIQELKSEVQAKFKITVLGTATFFPVSKISFLHQAAYVLEIRTSLKMLDCKTCPSPMYPGCLITLSQALNSTESLLSSSFHAVYRTAIGQILYLTTKTRPDIAVAVGVLARQVSAPAEVNCTAVKRILRYLKGTMMYGLHIAPTNDQLIGHADADWGGESGHKLVSGFVITLGNVPVSWGSNKQTAAALSSTVAEYASLSEAARETVWLRRLVEAMSHPQNGGTVITQDKTGSVIWANGTAKFARSRHVGIKMYHVQNLVESKQIITQ
jgi:hypothetical protein